MKHRLVFVRRAPLAVVERARAEFDTIYEDRQVEHEEALRLIEAHRAEAIFFTSTFKLDAAFIERLPARVKVASSASTFADHVDVAAARAKGLVVTCVPGAAAGCVADLSFALLLAAARGLSAHERTMRSGTWVRRTMGEGLGIRVWGKTLGIVGYGRVGQAMAQRARGFGMRILYHGPRRAPAAAEAGAEYFADLRAMLPQCQFLTLHPRLTDETRHLLNRESLALLPAGAVVVNASRGGLIDEGALIEALGSGHIAAAGLDVFQSEPAFDRRLAALDNVFLSPHVNSATVETRLELGNRTLDNIAAVLSGKPPLDPVWTEGIKR
jgi:lactate dehydrogenase-like 2-hydroxyacid dehydrogenase